MVGSYARDESRPDSDLDLVIITTTPELYIENAFIAEFGEILKVEKEDWGVATSLRTWYKDFLVVEFGLTSPNWIAQPLDPGTYNALIAGYQVLMDKHGYFNSLNLII